MLKEIFSFSLWTTISSLAQRLIFNITPSIIVAVSVTGAIGSAIFGLAATIEGYVFTFANAISGMFMTRISKLVYEGKKDTALVELMVKVGRLQCMIIGLLVTGFIAFGESFILYIWNKPNFAESYLCTILLIIPSYIYLPMQIANTTVIVENKVKLRSLVTLSTGILNVLLSLILSKELGALGASISIFVSYLFSTSAMVIIYIKVLRLNMWKFFKETFFKITPFLLVVMGVGLALEYYNPMHQGLLRFIINGGIFVVVFAVIMILFVLNQYEKNLFWGIFKKTLNRIK
jgi:O-antigen/teichoic acid export membrane protein